MLGRFAGAAAWAPKPRRLATCKLEKALEPCPPVLHLTDWEIGACPVLLAGNQTAMSLGRIVNFLYIFCRSFSQSCEFRHEREPSSPDGEEAEAKKRRLKEVGSEGSELPK